MGDSGHLEIHELPHPHEQQWEQLSRKADSTLASRSTIEFSERGDPSERPSDSKPESLLLTRRQEELAEKARDSAQEPPGGSSRIPLKGKLPQDRAAADLMDLHKDKGDMKGWFRSPKRLSPEAYAKEAVDKMFNPHGGEIPPVNLRRPGPMKETWVEYSSDTTSEQSSAQTHSHQASRPSETDQGANTTEGQRQ